LSKEQWRLGSLRVSAATAAPVTVAKRERDAQRALTDQAHGANLDLGHALVHNLTTWKGSVRRTMRCRSR
jgi:hypothetical protein